MMAPTARRKCQVTGCSLRDNEALYQMMERIQTQENVLKDLEIHMMADRLGNNMDTKTEKV